MTGPANPLSLDHLTIFDVDPQSLIAIAGELGCPLVSLWVQAPVPGEFPLVDLLNRRAVARSLADAGVAVHNLECFDVGAEPRFDDFRAALETGATLGARSAVAINLADSDFARVVDNFGRFCDLGAEFGLASNIEPISMGRLRTLREAVALLGQVRRPNAGITIDLLHLVRSGGSVADLGSIDRASIAYAQICDGPATVAGEQALALEGFEERMLPGTGHLPVGAFVAALPPGIPLAIEVPCRSAREAGISAFERARLAVEATRGVVAGAMRT